MKTRVFVSLAVFLFTGVAVMAWAAGGPPAVDSNLERLGMRLYNDKNLSYNGTQSCRNCHHHFAGFADITNHVSPEVNMVSTGADGVSKGGRNAPSAAYAGFSPQLSDDSGQWVGGMFWDGRADGSTLGDPLAEQAQGPPLNPVEMNMPSKEAIIQVIRDSGYVNLWNRVFGAGSLNNVDAAYDNFGRAIAAYERSADVTKFSSKYDTASDEFTAAETRGMALFDANCASCHSTTAAFDAPATLFTNYAYANIGVPNNPAVLSEADLGLGPVVDDPNQNGKFKVPTLRNIVMTAPYSHNGYFPTLLEMVEFINDRTGYVPDVDQNIDYGEDSVGNFGLSAEEINDIVAFLATLTDE
ncbi:cytochrome c551 peroxidase [Desulfosarcina variabilis str. Montpellier]|uniref:cytochrome-c peroxidase n=1 Tax=Desulfosarcina variabilis TaxID=2300 RepID=UPI003AFA45D7